jgi:putative transposase
LEEVRQKYKFLVYGYVVMPEHFHLLIGEPELGPLSVVMQVLKQKVSRRCLKNPPFTKNVKGGAPDVVEGIPDLDDWLHGGKDRLRAFWQKRYYDFNVFSEKKHVEKLRYIHRNPVTRGLVESPEQWVWSSFREYSIGERGPVKIK